MLSEKQQGKLIISDCPVSAPIPVRKFKPKSTNSLKRYRKKSEREIERVCDFENMSIEEIERDFNSIRDEIETVSVRNEIMSILSSCNEKKGMAYRRRETTRTTRPELY